MFILRFAFENHRSFRDEVDLTLVDPRVRTATPNDDPWTEHTARVAAIYGANASGKSGILDALRYMQACVESSSAWSKKGLAPRVPFALNTTSRQAPSTYVLDFVLDDIRHEYGFSMSPRGVEEEWLFNYPAGRKRTLFEREIGKDPVFGRELRGGGSQLGRGTEAGELMLTRGAEIRHQTLKPIHDAIAGGIRVARFGDSDRQSRLQSVISDIADGSLELSDLQTMLRVADVGIVGASVENNKTDERMFKIIKAIIEAGSDGDADKNEVPSDEEMRELLATAARSLMFRHSGEGTEPYLLPTVEQSTGTLTWLSLAAPALAVVRNGGVLAVDELDSSLHPQLAQVMIQMFRDEAINKTGAQLIFTTHDTYFLSPASEVQLRPDEVWFVEKRTDGASDLYRLSDFPTRPEQNFSRRYLQGRYGAIPSVAPSFLASIAAQPVSVGEVE